jgi:hypothetical protein
MKTVFLRALEADDKELALREAIRNPAEARDRGLFEVNTENFTLVPGTPFAYWVKNKVRRLFVEHEPLEASGRIARRTNGTTDDNRWIRTSWEIPLGPALDGRGWVPHVKGGTFAPYYSDVHLAIHWDTARRSYPGYLGTAHRPDVRPASLQHFFRPGLTWPRRTNGLSFRVMPANCIFGDKGPGVFVETNAPEDLLALCSIVNSAAYRSLVALQLARTELAQSFEAGLIQQTPVPNLTVEQRDELAALCRRAWALRWRIDTHTETSHAFVLPALLQAKGASLAASSEQWRQVRESADREFETIQAEIDARCFSLYGIDQEDQRAILAGFGAPPHEVVSASKEGPEDDLAEEDASSSVDTKTLLAELLSWAVGVAFGRFDLRCAAESAEPQKAPDPFATLPVCSTGMLKGDNGLPVAEVPVGYGQTFPQDGVLVDDPGHTSDLTEAVRHILSGLFGVSGEDWWAEVEAQLEAKSGDIRTWLVESFFDFHLKRYSKSRRRAPIYWQLAVPSKRYGIWIYAHRLSRDSLISIQNDVLSPKLKHEERHLGELLQSAGGTLSHQQSREIEGQGAFVEELRGMLDEVKRVAPLWHPSLDDGIVITMAPLWRLVPQHKAWQKELKSKWDDLVAGKLDWSHLAMHLWPDRVIAKCAEDRSLAISHLLEDNFWFEDGDGKWHAFKKPKQSVDVLIRERRSAAVAAALKSLLEAPDTAGGAKRTRKSRAA